MDIGTIMGCVLGGLLILFAIVFGGTEGLAPFWSIPALFIVFGGSAAALLIAFPLKPILKSFASVRQCFMQPKTDPKSVALG